MFNISEMNMYKGSRLLLSQWRSNVLALPSIRNYRESENFTFDWDKVPETLEKEKEKFEEYVEVAGNARFGDHKLNIENIEYTASQNPNEWAHVQYLVDLSKPRLIPGIASISTVASKATNIYKHAII